MHQNTILSTIEDTPVTMQEKKNFFSRFIRFYKGLPEKKQYVEFFTAILTVPVLLTVIILNVSSLQRVDQTKNQKPDPTPKIIITIPDQTRTKPNSVDTSNNTARTTPVEVCKKEIGPVDITSPQDGDTVTDNPLIVTIERQNDGYCAVVWSYRINNGRWSDYDDKSIAIYNPPKGQISLELRIKSVVTGQEKILTRKFNYDGNVDTTASTSGSVSN